MSYFANGGWHSATTLLAKATATLNNFSAPQQRSVDESISDDATENTSLAGSQMDPPDHATTQTYPQTPSTPKPSDAVQAPVAGQRDKFRAAARLRALPYLLRSTPATATVSVVPEEAERNAVSSSPLPSHAVADLHTKVAMKRPTLSEEASALTEGGAADERSASHEDLLDGVGSSKPRDVEERISNSALDGSPGTAEGPQIASKSIEDELSETRKMLNDATEQCRALHKRIRDLERENEEKTFQVKSVEEASLKEKANLICAHTAELESKHRQILQLQQSLEACQSQSKETEKKVEGLTQKREILGQEITKQDGSLGDPHSETRLLTVAKEALRDGFQKLETPTQARGGFTEDLQCRSLMIEEAKRLSPEDYRKPTATISQNEDLPHKLSSHAETVDQLHALLDAAYTQIDKASKLAEERAEEARRLQRLLSNLQEENRVLKRKVEDQESHTRVMEETSNRERAGLCNGLKDQVKKLEVQCRAGGERNKSSEDDLANANAVLQDLKEKEEIARKDMAPQTSQAARLRQQPDDTQKLLAGRGERIRRLEDAKGNLINALRRVQATVNGKELMIQGLQHQCTTLEGAKKSLEERVANLEKVSVEAKDTAQHMLEKTVEGHRREMSQAKSRIHELRAAVRKLEAVIEEKNGLVEDLRNRNLANEEARQRLEEEILEMEAEVGRTRHANQQALDQLAEDHHRKLTDATNTIQVLHNELSSCVATIAQLRASLDDSYTMTNEISKVAEDRAEEICRLQQFLSSLQEVNQALAQMVEDQESRLR